MSELNNNPVTNQGTTPWERISPALNISSQRKPEVFARLTKTDIAITVIGLLLLLGCSLTIYSAGICLDKISTGLSTFGILAGTFGTGFSATAFFLLATNAYKAHKFAKENGKAVASIPLDLVINSSKRV